MIHELIGGIRLAFYHWKQSISLGLICSVVAVVLSLILSEVLTQVEALHNGNNLRKAEAVVFSSVYPSNEAFFRSDKETLSILSHEIDSGNGYASVIGNVYGDEVDEFVDIFHGIHTIIVIGQEPFRLFPSLGQSCQAPCILRGAQALQAGSVVDFHGMDIPVKGVLPQSVTWFDPYMGEINLDHQQILLLRTEDIDVLTEYEQEELMTRAVFLSPPEETVKKYISSAREHSQHYLIPGTISASQKSNVDELMLRSALYVLALIAFSGLAFCAFWASLRDIITAEIRSFVIRRMCGAQGGRIMVRLLTFIAAAAVVVPLLACGALWCLGPPMDKGAKVMVAAIVLVYSLVALSVWRIVRRTEYVR
ncbi:hypothetical protein [Corynebacterium sp. sy039]|uniref:hypothetical protein n=1 Tax=Corynebacterium sp. sy039 TaxID=2599641 RepID=UPI0011B6586F|nr:hypothetical protein [Corynebacterium sp. sy039]QDZ41811.1 hypothetical protein FQV43_00495 [Corynebacterium sp. sy039]